MEKRYKKIGGEEKAKALKKHLVEHIPVSTVCDELGVAPSVFYTWQAKLFKGACELLGRNRKTEGDSLSERKIKALEERLRNRDATMAELMTEHLALKKSILGEI